MDPTHFAIAFLGGLIPAIFWLWFWLREDARKPEPLYMIILAFVAGMAVVPATIPLQLLACNLYQGGICQPAGENLAVAWVIIEETLKYAAALIFILWQKAVDEPIDFIIYLIAIALGFAAFENALFLFTPLQLGDPLAAIATGHFRVIGATLLHVLASGTIGVCLALAFYQPNHIRLIAGTIGLFIATVLHVLFNFFIIKASGETILGVFLFVWMGIIILFLLFEKVKLLERSHTTNPNLHL